MGCKNLFNCSHFIAFKSQERGQTNTRPGSCWYVTVVCCRENPPYLMEFSCYSVHLMDTEKIVGLSNTECQGMVYPLVGKISQLIWQVSIK